MTDTQLFLLLLIPALVAWYAQRRIVELYAIYSTVPNRSGLSGLDVARALATAYGLTGVTLGRATGPLGENYDPETKSLHLSHMVADAVSVTALGVVAHEIAHASQDADGYPLMRLRATVGHSLMDVAGLATIGFVGGLLFDIRPLLYLSAAFLAGTVLFAVLTLPVELNASERALEMLLETGLASAAERHEVSQVLRAAALTYVTGLAQRLATFLFFVVVVGLARA